MRATDRIISLLVGWVPDFSRLPTRRLIVLGAILSLLAHLIAIPLILLAFYVGGLVFPHRPDAPPAPQRQDLEVEIQPPEPDVTVVPAVPPGRAFIDPRGLTTSKDKPENALFESDRDMRAGSENPATGLLPLPSQEGRTDRSTNDFANQDVHLGVSDDGGGPQLANPSPPPTPASAQTPPPLYTPQPVAKEDLAKAEKAPDRPLPEPAKTARATPPPAEKVALLRPDQIPVPKPVEKSEPAPPQKTVPAKPTPTQMASWMPPLSTPSPLPGLNPTERYREQLEKAHVDGVISNRGAPGVDAIATPAGRWGMQTKNAIGKNWYTLIEQAKGMIGTGTVKLGFTIDGKGHVHDLHVESSTGSNTLVDVCLRTIDKTPIPSPPPALLEPLANHMMDYTITFNYY